MSYQPNGVVSGKQNICICENCEKGELYRCLIEPGKINSGKDIVNKTMDKDNYSDEENEFEEEYDHIEELEQNEMSNETYFDIVNIDSYVAIYADIESGNELFYLGKVITKGEADPIGENINFITDDYGHPIEVGQKYVTIHYLEKEESKSKREKLYTRN